MSPKEPRFDLDYNERGRPGEKYAEAIREAIYRERIEVKTDHLMMTTGNVYVEFEQKTKRDGWQPSGIAVDGTAELWMFCSPFQEAALVVSSALLKDIARAVWKESAATDSPRECKADVDRTYQHRHSAVGCCSHESKETNPTHGIKVPVERLMQAAWSVGLEEVA